MSEIAEVPMGVEKEAGMIKRVTSRIGKFLSENYTIKGAKAKEIGKYATLYAQFTPEQQDEMKAFYEKKVAKTATWKVIRNWVTTGAGLALGYGLLQPGNAALVWDFVTKTAPEAIKGGANFVYHWLFNETVYTVTAPAIASQWGGQTVGLGSLGAIAKGPGINLGVGLNILHPTSGELLFHIGKIAPGLAP